MTLQKSTPQNTPEKSVRCPYCGSKKTAQYDQKTVCNNCSSVIDIKRIKNNKPNSILLKRRLLQQSSQNSNTKPMAGIDFGESGHEKWQKLLRVSDATEKRLATTLFEITKIGQRMALPKSTLKLSLKIYKKIISSNQTRRKPTRVLAATIVYIACRQDGVATSINQIGHLSKIRPEKIRHAYNALFKKINPMPNHTSSEQYVNKLARSLFQQEKTIEIAEKIISTLNDQRFAQGKNPVGLVCSACYIASILAGEPKTQREIAELSRITEATMRTRYHEIARRLTFKIFL